MDRMAETVPVQPLLLSAPDAAAALSISERTLWGMTKAGEIPHVRQGRRVLYYVDDLRAWIESHRTTSAPAA